MKQNKILDTDPSVYGNLTYNRSSTADKRRKKDSKNGTGKMAYPYRKRKLDPHHIIYQPQVD